MLSPRTFIQRHWRFVALLICGLVGWLLSSTAMGDLYAVAVGPDFLVKIFPKIAYVVAAHFIARLLVKWHYPTIYDFTSRRGDNPSDFTRAWKQPLQNGHDPRLAISVAVHLGVFAAVCVIMALAF